ncbi:MAG: InlB B-repeat-containing protein [Oscillospiraceae bacterium]|nr:InlB B-repeat-containing protein [Oscillospiraceae bacterium]MBR3557201.1 InlB B-repeat-containing protein [Oscillospiraceae bacterium]
MIFRGTLRRCFVWLLCLSLCLGLAAPALAADNTGTEIRLLKTEGTVNVSGTGGKTYSTREDMRLYNGYVVSTEAASYAWITLDSEKAVKLDECSSLEVRRSGKTLELLLKSGEMYCDVTAPLKEDEKLNIRTSTMVTGVRGTIVYIQKISDEETRLGVLEGRAQGAAINPITGATRTLTVREGQLGVFRVYDADQAGDGAEAWLLGLNAEDVPPFVQVEIARDAAARDRVPEALRTPLPEALENLLKKQAETSRKLAEVEGMQEEEVISKDPLWEGGQGGDSAVYTITWNIGGHLETTACKAGQVPFHAEPVLEGCVFAGWSPALAEAVGDTTYVANFLPVEGGDPVQITQYTVTWIIDGVVSQSVYAEGVRPTHEIPVKNGYTFLGWDPEISIVTGDASYTAVFEEIQPVEEFYTITWLDDEGNILEVSSAAPGERPSYPGDQPTKDGCRFVGWEPVVAEAWADAEYTAVFEEIDPAAETGVITWSINGVEETEELEIGTTPSHEIPSREPSADLIYIFTGWYDGSAVYGPEEELPAVTGDATYTAEFSSEPRSYTVTWVIDGESTEESCEYGVRPTHEIPEKDSTEQYIYRFTGWNDGSAVYSPEILPVVTGDVTYTAEFEEELLRYTITWLDGDGNPVYEEQVPYGEMPEYGGDEPTKEADDEYRYTFNGTWEPEIVPAEGDAEYTAGFDSTPIYAISLVQPQGGALTADVQTAAEGEAVTVTLTPEAGYDIVEAYITYTVDGTEENRRLQGENGTYTFEMPAAAVTVEAMLEGQVFSIRALDPEEVDAITTVVVDGMEDATEARTGDLVTVRVSWDNEMSVLDAVTITWDGVTGGTETLTRKSDEVTDYRTVSTYEFTMPAGDVDVTAELTRLFEIYFEEMGASIQINGETVEDFYTYVPENQTVTLTIIPDRGYRIPEGVLPTVSYENTQVEVTRTGENTYEFTMPENNVFLNVELEEALIIGVSYSLNEGGTAETALVTISSSVEEFTLTEQNGETMAFAGETITITVTRGDAYSTFSVFANGTAIEGAVRVTEPTGTYTYVMPADGLSIQVELVA